MRRASRRGFTLLELLIAVAMLALVLAMIYQSYWVCTKTVSAAEERSDYYQAARLALRRLSDDLTCAYVPLPEEGGEEPPAEGAEAPAAKPGGEGGGFRASDGGSGPEARDTLEFASTANLAKGAAGALDFVQLSYQVQDGSQGQASLTRTSTAGQAEPQTFELAPNVKGLEFRFLNADGEETADWDSTANGALPAVVEITLYMGRPEDQTAVAFSTAVQLPLAWQREALGKGVAKLAAEEKAKEKEKGSKTSQDEKKPNGKPSSDDGGADDEGDEE